MSEYVQATSAYRFNRNDQHLSVARGDIIPGDHWAVRTATDPTWFTPVDIDRSTAQLVDDRMSALQEIDQITTRNTGSIGQWPSGQAERLRRTQSQATRLQQEIQTAEQDRAAQMDRLRALAANPANIEHGSTQPASPTPAVRAGGHGLFSEARRIVDAEHRSGRLPDYAAERVDHLIRGTIPEEADTAARWVMATGRDSYRTAFAKMLADPDRGHLLWNTDESLAFRAVAALQAEMRRSESRAMGVGTGGGGGFLVPFQLDPSILLTSDGSTNPLRRLARVEQVASDAWHGVTSAGAVAEWKSEHSEVSDASPALGQPGVPVHFGEAFVPYSFEVGMDAVGFLDQLGAILLDAADQLQAQAFMTGTGAGQPTGLLTGLPAGSRVAGATADALSIGDPVTLQNALPPRFQPRARFVANLSTINTIGSFETGNGALRYPEVGTGRLLNRALNEASHMATAGDAASAGNDSVLVYGDFTQFLIADRIGTTLELVPHLFGANHRPTGQRGALMWFRTGSDVLVDNAFRVLTT